MEKAYQNMTLDTVEILKAKGFINVEFIPLKFEKNFRALVEVEPSKNPEYQMGSIRLDSRDIQDYFGGPSNMARYVIDEKYLK